MVRHDVGRSLERCTIALLFCCKSELEKIDDDYWEYHHSVHYFKRDFPAVACRMYWGILPPMNQTSFNCHGGRMRRMPLLRLLAKGIASSLAFSRSLKVTNHQPGQNKRGTDDRCGCRELIIRRGMPGNSTPGKST